MTWIDHLNVIVASVFLLNSLHVLKVRVLYFFNSIRPDFYRCQRKGQKGAMSNGIDQSLLVVVHSSLTQCYPRQDQTSTARRVSHRKISQ